MIYSALYYAGSLARGDLIVRDNRFYPGKYSETFPLWWSYLRKHYPNEKVILYADAGSPVPLRPLLDTVLQEPWWESVNSDGDIDIPHNGATGTNAKVQVEWLDQYVGQYFRPMQRNLVEAMCDAYVLNQDMLWLDADAFLNTDILNLIHTARADFAAPQIAHHQMTADSVCTYISKERLHALDGICHLPTVLREILTNGPTDLRMHTFQEGGLYKLFCYGRTLALGGAIELSHLSCYDNFMSFLKRNPLDTNEYRALVGQLETVDWTKMPNVERVFHDMDYRLS